MEIRYNDLASRRKVTDMALPGIDLFQDRSVKPGTVEAIFGKQRATFELSKDNAPLNAVLIQAGRCPSAGGSA